MQERYMSVSNAMLKYDEVKLARKESSKEQAEEMNALRGEIRPLSKAIRSKGEWRAVKHTIRFHKPTVGLKRIIRLDTGDIVRDEQMSCEECQDNLFDDIRELDQMHDEGAMGDAGGRTA